MASDAYLHLASLLLRQSDRHPLRTLSGEDLVGIDAATISAFEQIGLITRERDLRDTDDLVFHQGEESCLVTSVEDGDVEPASPLALVSYRIEFPEIARLLRVRLGLIGPPVEAVNPWTFSLGARGTGRRRQEVFLLRCLKSDRAVGLLQTVREHAGVDASVAVLTPTRRDLHRAVLKQVDDVQVFALTDLLKARAEPFSFSLPTFKAVASSRSLEARLVIDSGGHMARFDGNDLGLQPRDFSVLLLLANEAKEDGGFVPNELIGETLRRATGGDGFEEQIDKSIDRIRKRLSEGGCGFKIKTIRGVGRRLLMDADAVEVL